MRFSLFYNVDVMPEQFVPALYCLIEAQVIRADQLGFETAWFAERHYQYDNVRLDPLPLQTPERLIWIAASASTPEWAGVQGYSLLVPRVGNPDDHRQWIARYRAACGRRRGYVAQLRFVFVAETERAAREQTRAAFARYAHYDCDVDWDGDTESWEYRELTQRMNMLIGTPAQVRAQLTAWQAEYDFDEILCQTFAAGICHEEALRFIELLGCEVLPRLRTKRNGL